MKIINHPYLLGVSIAVVIFLVSLLVMFYAPSVGVFLGDHKVWFDLGTYTASLFGLLVWWCWKWRARPTFWGVFLFLLAVHLLGFVYYIREVGPLSPFRYCLIAPGEALIVGFLAERGTVLLRSISRSVRDI
jgi:hypothetical protein